MQLIRDIDDKKAHSDLHIYVSGHKTVPITEPPFYQIVKSKARLEIVGAEI